jgi:integration host factor subunit beta
MATTKRELIKRVAKKTGQKQNVAKEIIQTFLDEVIEELARGNRLEFREFGVFHVTHKKERIARNPRTGAAVRVPKKTVVHFKVGRLMKEKVKMLAMAETGNAAAGNQPAGQTANASSGQHNA